MRIYDPRKIANIREFHGVVLQNFAFGAVLLSFYAGTLYFVNQKPTPADTRTFLQLDVCRHPRVICPK